MGILLLHVKGLVRSANQVLALFTSQSGSQQL